MFNSKNSFISLLKRKKRKHKIHIKENRATEKLKKAILLHLKEINLAEKKLIVLCIGSDRSTGDSLGPLVGRNLNKFDLDNTIIKGTLKNPIHAKNIQQTLIDLDKNFVDSFIIAIDASLGKKKNIGEVTVKKGPLKPGAAMNKNLPKTGDMQITGLVNTGGYMEYMVLQSTRLNLVFEMAKTISLALLNTIKEI